MMNFKSRNGFTFIEVLISLTIMGLMVVTIAALNGTIFLNTTNSHQLLDKTVLLKNFYVQTKQESQDNKNLNINKPIEKKIEEDKANLKYSLEKIKDSSVLNKQKVNTKKLFIEKTEISWDQNKNKRSEELITFLFKKEDEKKS